MIDDRMFTNKKNVPVSKSDNFDDWKQRLAAFTEGSKVCSTQHLMEGLVLTR